MDQDLLGKKKLEERERNMGRRKQGGNKGREKNPPFVYFFTDSLSHVTYDTLVYQEHIELCLCAGPEVDAGYVLGKKLNTLLSLVEEINK